LKNDTNTHGHQAWFCFQITNLKSDNAAVTLNICNLKRDLRLFQEGQQIYLKKINNRLAEWTLAGDKIIFKVNQNAKFTSTKVYKLTFELLLDASSTYEVSLLPPYTYSNMIKDVC
jgi:hypothetical protein